MTSYNLLSTWVVISTRISPSFFGARFSKHKQTLAQNLNCARGNPQDARFEIGGILDLDPVV